MRQPNRAGPLLLTRPRAPDTGGGSAGAAVDSYVRQSWCHFSQKQQWQLLVAPDSSYFRVQNQRSGLCLDTVLGCLTLQQCGSWPSQRFKIHDPSTPGLVEFESIPNGTCWGVSGASNDPDHIYGGYSCNGQTSHEPAVCDRGVIAPGPQRRATSTREKD